MEEQKENGKFEITVKAVVVNDERKVLILRRSGENPRCPQKLDMPGGGVNEGETLEDALKREIKEELNIEVEIGPIIHNIDWENKKSGYSKGFRLLAFYRGGEVKISGEHESFEWMNIDEAISQMEDGGFEKDKRDALIKAKEFLEMKDALAGWKRCRADFENYKKRQAENQRDLARFANLGMVLELLPVLDNFHSALEHVPEDQKTNPWVTGITHIQKQLEKVLSDGGLREIETKVGDEFNPEIHEAVDRETPDGKNKIVKVARKGYKIDEKVIRAAKVTVG